MGAILLIALFVIGLAIYFVPTIKANSVEHSNTTAIFVLNLFLGWLLIPWVVALVWAYKKDPAVVARELDRARPAQTKKCPFCAEEVRVEALKCKHCQSELPVAPTPVIIPHITVRQEPRAHVPRVLE